MNILLIDNNDSFTNNLEHLLAREIPGAQIAVYPYAEVLGRGEAFDLSTYALIIISPGPGCPADYPGYEAVIESGLPVLGVCLGMQILNEYLAGEPHGWTVASRTHRTHIFPGHNLAVARYHSLYCAKLETGLSCSARIAPMFPWL